MNRALERAIRDLGTADTADDDAILASLVREHGPTFADEVRQIDEARFQAQRYKEQQKARQKARAPLAAQSAKRRAERDQRAAVRLTTLQRAGFDCQGPSFGLPDRCRMVAMDRPVLEVHETAARGTHPGSHLDDEVTVALCQHHHDMVTSPVGEMRELCERVGLIVRATS